MRARGGLLAIFALLCLILTPAVAPAHHQDRGVDSDHDGTQNFDDTCPYVPVPAGGACNGAEDVDGDGYQKWQDPCDDNADNASCDSDGDGVPNQYDPCPNVADGHMLGSDAPLAQQSCPAPGSPGKPTPATDVSTGFGKGVKNRAGLSLLAALPRGQTVNSVLRRGLKLKVRCNRQCTAFGGALVGRIRGFAGHNRRTLRKRRPGDLSVRLSQHTRRTLRKRRRMRLTVLVAGVTRDGRFDSRIPSSGATISIASSGVVARSQHPRTISDTSRILQTIDERPAAQWWIGAARTLAPRGCRLGGRDIRGIPVDRAGLHSVSAGANRCAVARVWADISEHLALSIVNYPSVYYRVVVQLIPRSEGQDQCIQWVNVRGHWNNWIYDARGGGRCS